MYHLLRFYIDVGVDCFLNRDPQGRYDTKHDEKKQVNYKNQGTVYNVVQHLVADITSLKELRQVVEDFDGLDIKKGANRVVFGDGNPQAGIMFIGEAPGVEEDKLGIPFCGQSGKLLANILAAINLDRNNYYITNTIFWRPPANRRPTPEEIRVCRPFVEKHIALIKPKVIVLVGSTAVESLLQIKIPMRELRKKTFTYQNQYLDKMIKVFVVFHPSYLLRQAKQKKLMYYDILKINAALQ